MSNEIEVDVEVANNDIDVNVEFENAQVDVDVEGVQILTYYDFIFEELEEI